MCSKFQTEFTNGRESRSFCFAQGNPGQHFSRLVHTVREGQQENSQCFTVFFLKSS